MTVLELHNKLMSHMDSSGNKKSLGAFLGYKTVGENKMPQFAHIRSENVALIGPPGSGKSTKILAQSIACFPGLVIATTCRGVNAEHPDIIELTQRARQQIAEATGGTVVELGIDKNLIPFVKRVSWNLVEGCHDWEVAKNRAESLTFSVIKWEDGVNNQREFIKLVTNVLAPLLFVFAKKHKSYERLKDYVLDKSLIEFRTKLQELLPHFDVKNSDHKEARQYLLTFLNLEDKSKVYVFNQLRGVLENLPTFENNRITISELLQGHSTIYIQASSNASQAQKTAPIVATFIQSVVMQYQKQVSHKPNAVLLALDEVVNIAPIQDLPNILRTGGGSGIQTIIAIQDVESLSKHWPQETLVELCVQVLFSGISEDRYLKHLSDFSGELLKEELTYDLPVESYGISVTDVRNFIEHSEHNSRSEGYNKYVQKWFELEFKQYLLGKGIRWRDFQEVISKTVVNRNVRYVPNYTLQQLSNFDKNEILVVQGSIIEKRFVPDYWKVPTWNRDIFHQE